MNADSPPALPMLQSLREQGWELRLQATWIAPVQVAKGIPGISAAPSPPPRVNLVISINRLAGDAATDPLAAASQFIEQTAQAQVPGFRVEQRPAAITFADGHEGASAVVRFNATVDMQLRQHHLFRIDDDHCTQMVVTCDAEVQDAAFALAMQAALSVGSPLS